MVSSSPVLLEKHLGNSPVAPDYHELVYADNLKEARKTEAAPEGEHLVLIFRASGNF